MLRVESLRDYQRRGIAFMLNMPRANAWLDMGMGKSCIALSVIDALHLASSRFLPALVLAPKRVAASVWTRETQKWEHLQHLRVSTVIGTAAQRAAALRAPADVYTINYDNLIWLVDRLGADWPFGVVIADESTRLKSYRTRGGGKRARALSKIVKRTGRWVNLTGTPAPNGLIDLWGQQWFVDGGARLGRTFTAFKERWFDENHYSREIRPKAHARQEISELLADCTVSLEAKDWLDLPPTITNVVRVDLPPTARALYDRMEREMFLELGEQGIAAPNAAARTMKCLQLASGVVYTSESHEALRWEPVHDAKIEALREIVDAQNGAPLLVAYFFKSDRARILKGFNEAREILTPKDEDDWNAGRIPLGVIHPECLHPDTQVLTEYRGWVRLVEVLDDERVFDGVEFVSHRGCRLSGFRRVIDVFGIAMTSDHRMLIGGVWVEARDVRDTEGARQKARYAYAGDDTYLRSMLPLRGGTGSSRAEREAGQPATAKALCRMPLGISASSNWHAHLAYLDGHGPAVDKPWRQGLQPLRRCWSGLRSRVARLQELLSRHARWLPRRSDVGADQQQQGLLQRELPLGNQSPAAGEQVKQPNADVSRAVDAPSRVLPSGWSESRRYLAEAQQGVERRACAGRIPPLSVPEESQVEEAVYDLVDCGPRSRFLVRNEDGEVFVSHNSAGHGLNLQDGGSSIAFFTSWWGLESHQQVIERIGAARQAQSGYNRPVVIHYIVADNTLDEAVLERLQSKGSVQDALRQRARVR